GFGRAVGRAFGTWARAMRSGSSVQLSGRNSRRPTITGTSRDANVSETSDWQLAVFPSDEAYCGATPTEWESLLGQRRVIDDKKPSFIANQAICLLQQASFEGGTVPNSGSDEMMKLLVADLVSALRHGL